MTASAAQLLQNLPHTTRHRFLQVDGLLFAWSHAAPLSNHCALGNNPEPLNGLLRSVEKDVFFSEDSDRPERAGVPRFPPTRPCKALRGSRNRLAAPPAA